MTAGVSVPEETRAEVLRLARSGLSRNEVARRVDVSTATVSRICKAAVPPVTFDRTKIAQATDAKVQDAKARRAAISEGLLDDLGKIRDMLFTEQDRVMVTKDGDVVNYQAKPDAGDLRNLMTAIGIALDKHVVLARFDSDDRDLPAVEVFLRGQGVPSLFGQ